MGTVLRSVSKVIQEITVDAPDALKIVSRLKVDCVFAYIIINKFLKMIDVPNLLYQHPLHVWILTVIGIINLECVNVETLIFGFMEVAKAEEDAREISYGLDKTVFANMAI